MTAHATMARLKVAGVALRIDGGNLRCAPADKLTPELLADIRANKPELMALLSGQAEQKIDLPITPYLQPDLDAFEERAAVVQYDGGVTRTEAEAAAAREMVPAASTSERMPAPPRTRTFKRPIVVSPPMRK